MISSVIMLRQSTIRLIQLFTFIYIVFSTHSLYTDNTGLYHDVNRFLYSGFFHRTFFTPYQIVLLVLLVDLLLFYRTSLNVKNNLFLFACIVFISRMINPNTSTQSLVLGMPLHANMNEYIFLLMVWVLVRLHPKTSISLFEIVGKYLVIFTVLKAVIVSVFYFIGGLTTTRAGYVVILPEVDSQYVFSLVSTILLGQYLATKKIIYFLLSFATFLIIFISMQRTPTMVGFIGGSMLIVFVLVRRSVFRVSGYVMGFAILAIIVVFFGFVNPNPKMEFMINRYLGILKTQDEADMREFSDTGHKEQSLFTFLSVAEEAPFWGHGYGQTERTYVYGQSTEIHNNYARIWNLFGIISMIFYLYIIMLSIIYLTRLLKSVNSKNYQVRLRGIVIGFFLIGLYFAAWFMSGNLFLDQKLMVLWFLMFVYVRSEALIANSGSEIEKSA